MLEMQYLKMLANIFVLLLLFSQGILCQSIYLTPTQANVDINSTFTFTCTYNGYDEVKGTLWNIENTYTPSIIRSQDGTCTSRGLFANDAIYTVGCPSETSFTVTILRVLLKDHKVTWECFDRERKSNTVIMFVKVPVTNVILSVTDESPSLMKEYSRQIIKCRTSFSRPQPQVRWYLQQFNNSLRKDITGNSSTQTISSNTGDELVAVESTLQFYPNRTINKWMLLCEGWTENITRALESNKLTLNVTYPPDGPPSISGKMYRLIEYETGKLSCSISGGNPLARLTWKCYNNKPTSDVIDDETVFCNVTWIGYRGQTSCSCISEHSWTKTTQSTNITINVLYPPQKPTFKIAETEVSDVVNVILNNRFQIVCDSKSNPHPNYTWTGPDLPEINAQFLNVTIYNTSKGIYKCTTRNQMIRQNNTHLNAKNESDITVKVLYPPGEPIIKYVYTNGTQISFNKKIDVIEGDSVTMYCDAGGYPPPTIQWDGYERNNVLNITSITSNMNKTCTAKYKMEETVGETRTGKTTASVSIMVNYPPRFPIITVLNGTRNMIVTKAVQVKAKDNINMSCFSNANPIPNYTWSHSNINIQSDVRQFSDISPNDAGKYVCYVHNLMSRTFGDPKNGSNFSSIHMDVLYPSTIQLRKDESILEGSNLSIVCQVKPGKATEENISWTRANNSKDWRSHYLNITNVSRSDDADYTCTLTSRLIPTIGNEAVIVSNKTIHLNVFFPTEIKTFTVIGSKSRETFIKNKNDDVQFECTAEGNPASDLSLSHSTGTIISAVRNKNSLHHKITNASFENAGIYTCEGRNNYTKYEPPKSRLILIVKSPPRPSADSTFHSKVASALNASITLQFVAQQYLDEENKTSFTWFKQETIVGRNETRFKIATNGLFSNLSIRNITETDFGEYSIKVLNSVGEYIHYYELKAEDKPDIPVNFKYNSDSVTESSVMLFWSPGFNGGFQQTFILLYRINQEQKWHSVSIRDADKETINYTLTGLLSSKVYNVKIFAKNRLGNSSVTMILQFTTKDESVPNSVIYVTRTGAFVGVGVGTFAGTVMIVVVSLICYRRLSHRRKQSALNNDRHLSGSAHFSHSSSAYEDLDSSKPDGNVYNQVFEHDTYELNKSQVKEQEAVTETGISTENSYEPSVYVNLKI